MWCWNTRVASLHALISSFAVTKKLLEFLKEPSTVQPKKRSKQSGGLVQHSTSEDGLSALLAAASTTPTIPAKQAITITPGVWGFRPGVHAWGA